MKYFYFLLFLVAILPLSAQHNWTRTNPGGGGAISMLGATANGDIVAGSDLSGVYISHDNGDSWKVLGALQGLEETAISAFGFHPTDGKTFIIGTAIGAYKTTNNGDSIYLVDIETDPNLGLGFVESIGMAISDANIGYMAHHEWWEPELSFLKTIDAGDSWDLVSTIGIPNTARIVKLIVDVNDAQIVYALTGKSRFGCSLPKLYKSINGGQNWVELGAGYPGILDVDLHPTSSDTIYISTFVANDCNVEMWQYVNEAGSFYRSSDGGDSFTKIGDITGIISVGNDPENISLVGVFHLGDWNDDGGTWTTDDGGNTWSHTGYVATWEKSWAHESYAFAYSFYGLNKTITKNRFNPDNLNASFGQWGWVSIDAGNTIINKTSTEVSTDHFITNGLENIEGNAIDVSDVNPLTVYAGYYDIGFWASRDGGASWKWSMPDPVIFADYSWWNGGGTNCNFVVADPEREEVVWATFGTDNSSTHGAIFKSNAFGDNWQWSNDGLDSMGINTHGLSIDYTSNVNNRTLFVTQAGDVWRSTDDGAHWSEVLTNGGLKFTEVNKLDGEVVYAGGENGLYKSVDGGDSWNKIAIGEGFEFSTSVANAVMRDDIVPTYDEMYENPPIVAWQGVFDIKTDPMVANRVFVSVYGPGKGLYRSDDAGLTWVKKYDNNKMRGIAIAAGNSDVIYLGSSLNYHSGGYDSTESLGILVSYDGGDTWSSANDGMAWTNGGRIDIESGSSPKVWAWSPGTGVQYAEVPNFVTLVISENSFYGSIKDGEVLLHWSFDNATSLGSWILERSENKLSWETIANKSYIDGQINYSYWDRSPSYGNNYYRLKKIDLNQNFTYSDVISVYFENPGLVLYPNPVNDIVKIKNSLNQIDNIKIFNQVGQMVLDIDRPQSNINVQNLPQGTYTVLVRTGKILNHHTIIVQ